MPVLWQRLSAGPLQDDPFNAGLLNQRRTLLATDDDEEYEEEEDDEEDDFNEASTEDEDTKRSNSEQFAEEDEDEDGESNRAEDVAELDATVAALSSKVRGRISAHAEEGSDDKDDEENGLELCRHHKHHHKKHHHKKHHHKHKKDRQQCRYLEGLSRSIVKFGTSSGDYLAVSHGNNTCYQAVSRLCSPRL